MSNRLRVALSQLRSFLRLSQARGHGLLAALLLRLPLVVAGRGWRKLSGWINNGVLAPTLNCLVLRRFHRRNRDLPAGHFYVIVMPGSLHFLIPCLRQLPPSLPVVLLFNGAAGWERALLRRDFPQLITVALISLPHSSIGHGQVISLLLAGSEQDFGLLDHDLYVYKPAIFQQLILADQHCMKAVFKDTCQAIGRDYPHTWFLFFNAAKLKQIMRKYRVSARSYKRVPARLRGELAAVGLSEGVFLKDYLNYFDTLHLLLALAWYEGLEVAYESIEPGEMYHLGGTSIGSLATKTLPQLYMGLCFLEYVDHPQLTAKYLPQYAPFTCAAALREQLPTTLEVTAMLRGLDHILDNLSGSRSA